MFVVRDVFHLKFGKAREAREAIGKFTGLIEDDGYGSYRLLTDFTGPSYRLILEFEFESLGAYEENLSSMMGREDWRAAYQGFIPYVDSSYREILRVVES